MKRSLAIVLEKDPGGGYIASVPALPGCYSQGETLDEVRAHIREAIELYLEDETLGPLPQFVSIEHIEIPG